MRPYPSFLTRRRAFVGLGAVLVAVAFAAAGSIASNPPAEAVTVPSAPGSDPAPSEWKGEIPVGVNPSSDCDGDPTADHHVITLHVPNAGYKNVKVTFTFEITWSPNVPGGTVTPPGGSDEILTVMRKAGDEDGEEAQEVGSSDTGEAREQVVATNLPPGDYDVLACGFTNTAPQAYDGKLTIETAALAAQPSLASAATQGLSFSAAVASDNQRDEAEPLVEIDKDGLVYTCGPTGFGAAADYGQVSTDGGMQFHLLGTPPRGQQSFGGGGDCAVALGETRNADGSFQYAYAGLGPLTGFATSTSPDGGHRIASAGPSGNGLPALTSQGALADRQWMTFVDDHTVLLSYNQQQPRNVIVQRSTDGGLVYSPLAKVAAPNPRFPGPMRYDPVNDVVFFGWDKGENVNLAISHDKGDTWTLCKVDVARGQAAGFVTADSDNAGNIYIAWADKVDYHTYVRVLPAGSVLGCDQTVAAVRAQKDDPATADVEETGNPTKDPGWGPRVQVDRDQVRTTVWPWLAAGGAPGRVAVTFYGTESDGDPNTGQFDAAWDVYVNQSVNALGAGATFSQVKATTHPFHYDSICLNGLGCDVSGGDRSMADFFAIDYNAKDGKLYVVFNRTNKKPEEAAGHVATPMVIVQTGGPSNGGGDVTPGLAVLRSSSTDPAGDALSNYSLTGLVATPPAPATANEPAADFVSASIGPDSATGGLTVTMKVADLFDAALNETLGRTGSQSLLWVWKFTNGYQDAAATAWWNADSGFHYGFNNYATGGSPCVSAASGGDKCIVYPADTPIAGSVDRATGTITLTVPRSLLRELTGPTGDGQRPAEAPAMAGSRFYDGTAFSLGNASPAQDVQSFLYPLDNTPAMDFLLPAAAAPAGGGGGSTGGGGSSGGGSSGGGGGTTTGGTTTTTATTTQATTTNETPPAAPPAATTTPTTVSTPAAPAPPAGGVAGVQKTIVHAASGWGAIRARVGRGWFWFRASTGGTVRVHYDDKKANVHLRANGRLPLRIDGRRAVISGRAKLNGKRTVTFTLIVLDRGKSDHVQIALGSGYRRAGAVVAGGLAIK